MRTKQTKTFDEIQKYDGANEFIKLYKWKLDNNKKLSDFEIEYAAKNLNYPRRTINKVVTISSELGGKLQEKYSIDFRPEKIFIGDVIGEMGNTFHCYVQFRRSISPQLMFIHKTDILIDFFTLISTMEVNPSPINFNKYDKLTELSGRKLKEHQKTAVDFLLHNKKCILADTQGLGKTTSAIVAAMEGGFKRILIITTKSLKTMWKKEICLYEDPTLVGILNGSQWVDDAKYTIVNYDIISNFYEIPTEPVYTHEVVYNKDGEETISKVPINEIDKKTGKIIQKRKKTRNKAIIQEALSKSPLVQAGFDCVIIDEVQKLSNNTSRRYKTISDFLKRSKPKAIFLITATPLTNKPLNLYYILSLIDAPITYDYNYYCKRYCDGHKIRLKATGKEIMIANGATHLDELKEKIKYLYIRRLQTEIPGMVDKTVLTRYYDLDEKQRERYNELWEEYVHAQEEQGNMDSETYRELVEGIIVRQYLANEMVSNTIDIVDDHINFGEKVIIVCTFQEEINKFKEYYGHKAVVYNGKMSIKQKDEAVKMFMESPQVMVFIGQIIACGVGLTLTASNFLVFNSYSWVAADNKQVEDRIYRLNQTKAVTCVYQLFTDSISQHMFEKVIQKEIVMNKTIKSEKEKLNT